MSIVSMVEVIAQLDIDGTAAQQTILQTYIDAADAYVTRQFGTLPSGTYTETAVADNIGAFVLAHDPILTVTSITSTDGTSYTDSFTIDASGVTVTHPSITSSGVWTVVYTAGYGSVPADLKLAVLFDIDGLYRTSQIGPPGALGIAAVAGEYQAEARNPIVLWPRIDRWLAQYPNVA